MLRRGSGAAALLGLCMFLSGPAQAQVVKNLSNEKLEGILANLNITYKKTQGNKEGIWNYDYTSNNFQIRLTNHNGKYLWIDALFNDRTTLDEMNRWNRRAKFSRAVLLSNQGKETISLEAQLDCQGGVTDGMIRQLVVRFDGEVKDFVKFMSK